jgi:hypothetical protein
VRSTLTARSVGTECRVLRTTSSSVRTISSSGRRLSQELKDAKSTKSICLRSNDNARVRRGWFLTCPMPDKFRKPLSRPLTISHLKSLQAQVRKCHHRAGKFESRLLGLASRVASLGLGGDIAAEGGVSRPSPCESSGGKTATSEQRGTKENTCSDSCLAVQN